MHCIVSMEGREMLLNVVRGTRGREREGTKMPKSSKILGSTAVRCVVLERKIFPGAIRRLPRLPLWADDMREDRGYVLFLPLPESARYVYLRRSGTWSVIWRLVIGALLYLLYCRFWGVRRLGPVKSFHRIASFRTIIGKLRVGERERESSREVLREDSLRKACRTRCQC